MQDELLIRDFRPGCVAVRPWCVKKQWWPTKRFKQVTSAVKEEVDDEAFVGAMPDDSSSSSSSSSSSDAGEGDADVAGVLGAIAKHPLEDYSLVYLCSFYVIGLLL